MNKDIINIIIEYIDTDIIMNTIEKNIHKLNFTRLCFNEDCYHIIKRNFNILDEYDIVIFFRNCNDIDILKENQQYIDRYLSSLCHNNNKYVIKYIEEYILNNIEKYIDRIELNFINSYKIIDILYKNNKIKWDLIITNKYAKEIIEKNLEKINNLDLYYSINLDIKYYENKDPDYINWRILCSSNNKDIIQFISKNIQSINKKNWKYLSLNTEAYNLFENNIDKLYWFNIFRNTNNKITNFIFKHLDMIDNKYLWLSKYAIYMIDKYENDIIWEYIELNKIFWKQYPTYLLQNILFDIFQII